ncbi:unnamed protein product [Paramecium pentaurelia]|uniref:Uncharacterized protein n=1 Tax=Paramecium pentaurelia TaxID=43138 RepID=A0A8S1SGY7_9CILI|nr:unnamed protein product [Paramecium pentaurelia]
MDKQIINSKQSAVTTKIQTPHRTTAEQIYIKRLKETEAFIPKEEFIQKQEKINKAMESQSQIPLKYYSHINEIRSVKEFLYISEKLKQKNIERKMNERLELRGKLNKIKEIEVLKKLHYYLEKKIRLFIKDRQHDENPQMKTFEAFRVAHKEDKRIMQFPLEFQKEIFQKLDNQPDIIQSNVQKQKMTSTNSDQQLQKRNSQFDLFSSEFSESINKDNNEDGTSKFLTLKVANKLLGMMIVESSKGKRQPIIWAQDKKKELEGILNKPYGGKMNFNVHSFNWLIDNALSRSQSLMNINKRQTNRVVSMDERVEYQSPINNHKDIQNKINQGIQSINKTFYSRPRSTIVTKQRKELKNRKQVTTEYNITDRIKENVTSQALRNSNIQSQQKTESIFFQNDSYVNHYI